jgi:hypothetical protein
MGSGKGLRARRSGVRQGKVRSCKDFKLWHGSVRSGAVRLGRARFGFHARAWLGSIRYSGVRFGKGFVARLGAVWRSHVRQGMGIVVPTRLGSARHGGVDCGSARISRRKEMSNILSFEGITTLDLDPDMVLQNNIGKLEGFVLVGYTSDGKEYTCSTYGDTPTILWLLERAKKQLLESADYDDEDFDD